MRGDASGCADALWQARQFGWRHAEWAHEDADFARVRDAPAVLD